MSHTVITLLFGFLFGIVLANTNSSTVAFESRPNPLFFELQQSFTISEQSHILLPKFLDTIESFTPTGYKFYSAYGVFFPKEFAISAHKDYQCSLCDGDFKALMIPKYLHPNMAKVCSNTECLGAYENGFIWVNVCEDHYTQKGIIDRIQINIYFTNSSNCSSKGLYDQFDCEAELFGTSKSRKDCTTSHPDLLSLVKLRNSYWDS